MSELMLTTKLAAKHIHTTVHIIEKLLDVIKLSAKKRLHFIIALREALDNAICHGNKRDENKPVEIECTATEAQIICSIKDVGYGFDYQPFLNQPLEEFDPERLIKKASQKRTLGLGLSLIRKCADEVSFNKEGNKITFVKYLTTSSKK